MEFQTIIILSAVLELIMLICFFVLCNNMSKIKTCLIPNENFRALFLLYYAAGEIEKAKELLLKEISKDNAFIAAFYSDCNRADAQQVIDGKYGKLLKMVDVIIDFDAVNAYLKSIS